MPKVRLHLDADASRKALHQALLERGHDVTRTPSDWIQGDASDEIQLLSATAQGTLHLHLQYPGLHDSIEIASAASGNRAGCAKELAALRTDCCPRPFPLGERR